jgi:hypothetical protein
MSWHASCPTDEIGNVTIISEISIANVVYMNLLPIKKSISLRISGEISNNNE